MLRALPGFVAAVAFCASAVAHPDLDAGKAALAGGDVHTALSKLDDALRSGSTTDEELAATHWYRALCYHALGRKQDVADALDALIAARPLFMPDFADVPPDLRALFLLRVRAWKEKFGVSLVRPRLDGETIAVDVEGNAASAVEAVLLARAAGQAAYLERRMIAQGAVFSALLDEPAVWLALAGGAKLEITVEARNARGAPIALLGDALHPVSVDADAARAAEVSARWHTATTEVPANEPAAPSKEPVVRTAPAASSTTPVPALALRIVGVAGLGVSVLVAMASAALGVSVAGLRLYDLSATGWNLMSREHSITFPMAVASNAALGTVIGLLLLGGVLVVGSGAALVAGQLII